MEFTLYISVLFGWASFRLCMSACVTSEHFSICPSPLVIIPGQSIGQISFTCYKGNEITDVLQIEIDRFKNDGTKEKLIAIYSPEQPVWHPVYFAESRAELEPRSKLTATHSSLTLTVNSPTFTDLEYKYQCEIRHLRGVFGAATKSDLLTISALPDPRPVTMAVPDPVTVPIQLTCTAVVGLTSRGYSRGTFKFQFFNDGSWRDMSPVGDLGGQSETRVSYFMSSSETHTVRGLDFLGGCTRRFRCYVQHKGTSFVQYAAERTLSLPPGTSSCPASGAGGDSKGNGGADEKQTAETTTAKDDSDPNNDGDDGTDDETDGNDDSTETTSNISLYIGLTVVAILVVAGLLSIVIAYLRRGDMNPVPVRRRRSYRPPVQSVQIVAEPTSTSYSAEDTSMSTSYVVQPAPVHVAPVQRPSMSYQYIAGTRM